MISRRSSGPSVASVEREWRIAVSDMPHPLGATDGPFSTVPYCERDCQGVRGRIPSTPPFLFQGRRRISSSIQKQGGGTILPNVTVNAQSGKWFFITGQSYSGGTLIIALKVL